MRLDRSRARPQACGPRKSRSPAFQPSRRDPPQAWGTVLTPAGHANQAIQSSHPNDISPKPRRCRSFKVES